MNKFIKGLIGKKKENPDQTLTDETIKLTSDVEVEEEANTNPVTIVPTQYVVGCAQSVGMTRDHNEDSIFALNSVFSDGETQMPFGIFIVADGMGGHQNGEIASRYAVKTVSDYLVSKLFSPILGLQNESSGESLIEILESAIDRAQQNVLRKAPGGGTTLTISILIGSQMTIGHVGDSRIYFIYRDGRVEPLTQDHSLVNRLYEQGHLSKEEAENHPQRNVLYRAIGQIEPFKPDIQTVQFPENALMLICSDGLWGVITPEEIFKAVSSTQDLPMACHLLTEAANRAGGPDNISVILVKQVS